MAAKNDEGTTNMLVIAVMYPAGSGAFDHSYYRGTHMPMVRRLWEPMGLTATQVMLGVPAPDGAEPAYVVTTLLTFEGMAQFTEAAAAHGREIFADIPNFTAAKPALLFNEPV